MAKNLIVVNKALFDGFPSIVIAALSGNSPELNPNETLRNITSSQISWLSSLAFIAHPIGSVVGGKLCDAYGRRKIMMAITVPIFIAFAMLGFATSYEVICIGFAALGFIFGLKEAPTITYCSEISETSIRSTLMAIGPLASSIELFIVYLLGSFLPWRQVSFICAIFPIAILIAVFMVPESPIWLLSKCRPNEAQKSLQWLRGWVSPQAIHAEYSELEKYSKRSNACTTCARQSIRCNHPRPKLCENLGEFKRKRSLKPFILIVLMQFFVEFSGISFTFFPLGWSSFENANDAKYIQKLVGNFGCLAMILVFVMQFFTKMGVGGATLLLIGEVFPFKVRSFLAGVAVGSRYIFASIATKTYYDVENWLSLPGAISFYGCISLIGFLTMYLILPETERRSLNDIEIHYSDNSKGLTDIDIRINGNHEIHKITR